MNSASVGVPTGPLPLALGSPSRPSVSDTASSLLSRSTHLLGLSCTLRLMPWKGCDLSTWRTVSSGSSSGQLVSSPPPAVSSSDDNAPRARRSACSRSTTFSMRSQSSSMWRTFLILSSSV